ncbi:MAG: hypothetical protein U9Q21_03120 [Candidatus Auribacterota bacterium]|nr:hypothetical protein [Candidatus Auribacterota bacterium]
MDGINKMVGKYPTMFLVGWVILFLSSATFSETKIVTLDDLRSRFTGGNSKIELSTGKNSCDSKVKVRCVQKNKQNNIYVRFKLNEKGWHEVIVRVATFDSKMALQEILENGLVDGKTVSVKWIQEGKHKGKHTYAYNFSCTKDFKYAVAEIKVGDVVVRDASSSKVNVDEVNFSETENTAKK